jgi:hypothetical protein
MAAGLGIEVKGVPELINQISKFDKEVYKILTKEVRQALSSVAKDAIARTPKGRATKGWGPWTAARDGRDLSFNGAAVKRGIVPQAVKRSQRGRVVKFSGRVITKTPAGAIFALAGSRGGGEQFEDALNRRNGDKVWPRTLTPALYAKGPQAARDIEAAIKKAAENVTGRRK